MKSSQRFIVSLMMSLALPVAVVISFPYSAVGFKAANYQSPGEPAAKLISLTAEQEISAVRKAKSIWRGELSAAERARTWLTLGELPEDDEGPIIDSQFSPPPSPVMMSFQPPPLMPSRAAAAVLKMAAEPPATAKMAFPREELLELK